MGSNNADDKIALYLKAQNPTVFAGWDNDKVVQYARQKDPGFDSYAKHFYGSSISANGALDPAVRATQPIRDIVSSGINAIDNNTVGKTVNDLMFPLAKTTNRGMDALSKDAENTADKIALSGKDPVTGDMFRTLAGVLGVARLPESLGEASAMLALGEGAGAVGDLGGRIAGGEKLSLPSFNRTVINPTTGSILKIPVPDAEALASSDFISNPETHGALAQSHVQSLLDATKSQVNNEYNKLTDLVGTNGTLANYPIDVSDASRIANEADQALLQHPDFQTAAFRKMRSVLANEPQESNGVDVGHKAGSVEDWHDLEPSGTTLSAQDVVSLRKSLNKIYGSNYKNPTGNLAGQMIDSLDKSFKSDAPDILKEANDKATSAAKNYYDTFHNKAVKKFLESSPEKAHGILSSVDNLNAIRNAGGDVALEHLRRSSAFDLYNDIVDKNMSSNDVLAQFRRNRAMDALFSDEQVSRFANVANSRLAAIQAQIEGNPQTIGEKVMSAMKKAASSATGGAIGGAVGGIPGAITGAGAGAGLSDIIGK